MTDKPTNVYAKIAAVQGELAKVGIAKGRRNQQQGYNFRGIDEVYAALSPLLARYGLVIVPRVIGRECVERASARGGALFNVTVHAEFDFVSADDGSIHTASTYGEAMDSADKATNKAMSAAYKYAAFMTFAIPTEGDNDADATTHEVAAQAPPAPAKREGPPKTHLDAAEKRMVREIEGCGDADMLDIYLKTEEAKADYNLLNKYQPHSITGPHPDNLDGFISIADRIKAKRDAFARAAYLTA